jgi:mRNA interferase RelE/StbE
MIAALTDARIKNKIVEAIEALRKTPNQAGKSLRGKLAGYRSKRAGQRNRVIFKVGAAQPFPVTIVAVGIRREGSKQDVYAVATDLAAKGTL